jgi:hypothetical protein
LVEAAAAAPSAGEHIVAEVGVWAAGTVVAWVVEIPGIAEVAAAEVVRLEPL